MTRDREDRRARRLLRMGSEAGPAGLRPGFMERLRARLAAEERREAEARAAAGPASGGPLEALVPLARPALAFALGAVLLAGIFFAWSPRPGAAPGEESLVALLEDSPALRALVSGETRGLLPLDDAGGLAEPGDRGSETGESP